ncbi:unnamed protein product, partial [marine sediment metagenome]
FAVTSSSESAARRTDRAPLALANAIGLHTGQPIAEEEDLFGTLVIIAARICCRTLSGRTLGAA